MSKLHLVTKLLEVGNYYMYEYQEVNEIIGQAGNFVIPEIYFFKSGSRCWQRPKKAFATI
jgi:hypothetical protein